MRSWSTSVVLLWLHLHGVCIGKELGQQVVHQLLIEATPTISSQATPTHNIFQGRPHLHQGRPHLQLSRPTCNIFPGHTHPRPATPIIFPCRTHNTFQGRPHLQYLQYLPRPATPAVSFPTISFHGHTCNIFDYGCGLRTSLKERSGMHSFPGC